MSGRFKGRSLSVINDLTVDEQLFLYEKTRELKEAFRAGESLDRFRLKCWSVMLRRLPLSSAAGWRG